MSPLRQERPNPAHKDMESRITVVDLAGSERQSKTDVTSAIHSAEAETRAPPKSTSRGGVGGGDGGGGGRGAASPIPSQPTAHPSQPALVFLALSWTPARGELLSAAPAGKINMSLLILGRCLSACSGTGAKHIPVRESVLTKCGV